MTLYKAFNIILKRVSNNNKIKFFNKIKNDFKTI